MKSNILTRIQGILFILPLLAGAWACTQGQNGTTTGTVETAETGEPSQGAITTDSASPPDCQSPQFKDQPGCQWINTSFHGELNLGGLTIKGVAKNSFSSDGKVEAIRFYPDENTTVPSSETLRSYTPDGKLHIETIRSDLEPAGGGDNIIDFQTTYTYDYHADGSYRGRSVVSHKVPKDRMDRIYEGGGGVVELDTGQLMEVGGGRWEPNPTEIDNYILIKSEDSEGRLLASDRLDKTMAISGTAPDIQKRATQISNEYDGDKLTRSEMTVYDCPSQPSPNLGECYYEHMPQPDLGKSSLTLHPHREPFVIQTSILKYDDKGRASRLDVEVDGDIQGPNPQKPVDDGTLDHVWWCDFAYDDAKTGSALTAFPEEFKILGLGKHDKLASITCDDREGLASGRLVFDGWARLHEVDPEVAGPRDSQ